MKIIQEIRILIRSFKYEELIRTTHIAEVYKKLPNHDFSGLKYSTGEIISKISRFDIYDQVDFFHTK